MKLISNLLCMVFIVWVTTFFLNPEKKSLPTNEDLISQFEKMEVFKKNEWKKGNVVDGTQVYTARTTDNILKSSWLLGVKQAGVISISTNHDPAFAIISALSLCYRVVKGVTVRDSNEDFKTLEDIFKGALSSTPVDGSYRGTGMIDGYKLEINMGSVGSNAFSYTCVMKEK